MRPPCSLEVQRVVPSPLAHKGPIYTVSDIRTAGDNYCLISRYQGAV